MSLVRSVSEKKRAPVLKLTSLRLTLLDELMNGRGKSSDKAASGITEA